MSPQRMRFSTRISLAALLGGLAAATVLVSPSPAFAAPPAPSGAGQEHIEEMNLAVNETKTIPAKGIRNYSVADPSTIDVRVAPDGSQFVVVGKKAGSTTVLLIKDDGSQVTFVINVSTRPPEVVYRELQQLLEGDTGVKIRRVGGRFFLEGGVTTEPEAKRIGTIAALYPGQVENLVNVGSGAGDRRTLVRVDFFFVQYDRTSSYGVGIGYPLAIGGDTIGLSNLTYDLVQKAVTSATASIVSQPLPRLDIAAKNGWAKVMKQSSIITSNGQEAVFNSGGEVNFRQFAFQNTSGVQKIIFGTNVTVLPRYDSATREVEVKLLADVSDLTPAQGGDLPGRNLSRLESIVNLKLGQALILSGIRSSNRQHSVSGLPLLSQIPVLGILFGSHSNGEQETENAMFVIPSVVETVPKSSLDLIKNATNQFKDYSGDIDSVNTFDRTPPSAKNQ